MAEKSLVLFVVVVAAALIQGQTVPDVTLADQVHLPYLSNPLTSLTVTVYKSISDILVLCQVNFPDGTLYETYPTNGLPAGTISAPSPIIPSARTCSLRFSNSPVSASGSYKLMSTVRHPDNSQTRFIQNHNVTIIKL